MSIRAYQQHQPQLGQACFVDAQALVLGEIELGDDSSVWPMAVVRGDVNFIRIGARTNVQDGAVLHVSHTSPYQTGYPLLIGDDVTIGHNATVHACTVGDRCLIGMNAVVLDGAVLEDNVILAAGSLVPPGKTLASGYLWLGNPVKAVRELTAEELEFLKYSAEHYVRLKDKHFVES